MNECVETSLYLGKIIYMRSLAIPGELYISFLINGADYVLVCETDEESKIVLSSEATAADENSRETSGRM